MRKIGSFAVMEAVEGGRKRWPRAGGGRFPILRRHRKIERPMKGSAVFSTCGRYRYVLRRAWNPRRPAVLFVGLNPSTADASSDDPTIRRCVGFARDWNFGQLIMANLFAYRATQPRLLSQVDDPIGPHNDQWLGRLTRQADLIVAAWGVHGNLLDRDAEVLGRLPKVHCLGLTQRGQPRHPLYLPAGVRPVRFWGQRNDSKTGGSGSVTI
jgi:hypothetical protein